MRLFKNKRAVAEVEKREVDDREKSKDNAVVLNYTGLWDSSGAVLEDGHLVSHGALWEFLTRYRYMMKLANITDINGVCILDKSAIKMERIVEYGCDWGHAFSVFEPYFKEVYGIEPMGKNVKRGRSQGRSIYHGIMEETPWTNEYFDVCVSHHVLEHGKSPEAILSEMYRILKVGGWAVHTLPCSIDGLVDGETAIHKCNLSYLEWLAKFEEHGFDIIRDFWLWNHDREDWTIVARRVV